MGKGLGMGLAAVGIALVVAGTSMDSGSRGQIFVVMGGFVAATAGIIAVLTTSEGLESTTGAESETDTRARVRILGVVVTLASLALPYIRIPLEPGVAVDREAYSLIGLIQALNAGTQVEGGLTLLIFMSVVIAGGFASLLHHFGGYVILFGTGGYGYVVRELTGVEPVEVIISEFQIGLYVAVVGALIIIGSSFLSYETAEKDRSWYGSGR